MRQVDCLPGSPIVNILERLLHGLAMHMCIACGIRVLIGNNFILYSRHTGRCMGMCKVAFTLQRKRWRRHVSLFTIHVSYRHREPTVL